MNHFTDETPGRYITRKTCEDCGELFVPLKDFHTRCFDCRIKAQKTWRQEREQTIEEHEKTRTIIRKKTVHDP